MNRNLKDWIHTFINYPALKMGEVKEYHNEKRVPDEKVNKLGSSRKNIFIGILILFILYHFVKYLFF